MHAEKYCIKIKNLYFRFVDCMLYSDIESIRTYKRHEKLVLELELIDNIIIIYILFDSAFRH